jgi:hypothetical protein
MNPINPFATSRWAHQKVAKIIKDTMDKKYGPTWQCIVGGGLTRGNELRRQLPGEVPLLLLRKRKFGGSFVQKLRSNVGNNYFNCRDPPYLVFWVCPFPLDHRLSGVGLDSALNQREGPAQLSEDLEAFSDSGSQSVDFYSLEA